MARLATREVVEHRHVVPRVRQVERGGPPAEAVAAEHEHLLHTVRGHRRRRAHAAERRSARGQGAADGRHERTAGHRSREQQEDAADRHGCDKRRVGTSGFNRSSCASVDQPPNAGPRFWCAGRSAPLSPTHVHRRGALASAGLEQLTRARRYAAPLHHSRGAVRRASELVRAARASRARCRDQGWEVNLGPSGADRIEIEGARVPSCPSSWLLSVTLT